MKKILFLLVLLSACTAGEGPTVEVSILGKWYYDYYEVNGERTTIVQPDSNCTLEKIDYIEFTPDGGLISYSFHECNDVYEYDVYSLTANKLTIMAGNYSTVSEIIEFSATSLILQAIVDSNGDGALDVVVSSFKR
ncbi:MAG: lipocalin family protein [Maribacter sp.]|nr:lipocalin family protein [Maribacter sp.]